MLLPNKIFSYNQSIISKFPIVLKELAITPLAISALYLKVNENVPDISEYIEVLDCLYALRKIEYDKEMEVLKYVS